LWCEPFQFPPLHVSSPTAQIFFPRSIESELAAQDAGIRSRGLLSSRNRLTVVSHEQELYGVYDVEESVMDSKTHSPTSPYQKPMPLPSLPHSAPLPPPPPPQEHASLPPPPVPPAKSPPTEIRLTPNRRRPSLDNSTPPNARPSQNFIADRFENPATKVSRLRPSFRGTWSPRTPGAASPRYCGVDHERGRFLINIDRGGPSRR
jgi:hypothetical protein